MTNDQNEATQLRALLMGLVGELGGEARVSAKTIKLQTADKAQLVRSWNPAKLQYVLRVEEDAKIYSAAEGESAWDKTKRRPQPSQQPLDLNSSLSGVLGDQELAEMEMQRPANGLIDLMVDAQDRAREELRRRPPQPARAARPEPTSGR